MSDRAADVNHDILIMSFVQGARWWEYRQTGATMWQSDQIEAEAEAEKRWENGTLGISRTAETKEAQ